MEAKPKVIVIAGPNGVGKSTAAKRLLKGPFRVTEFVNADVIAQGLSEFQPEKFAITAGRIMLTHLKELADQRANFAFETTLASRSFAPWIGGLCESGYEFHLFYIWVPSPDFAVGRVAHRVSKGGHHVPEDTIRRRYVGGVRNFFELYRPLTTRWRCYNGSVHGKPRLIALGRNRYERIHDKDAWQQILSIRDHDAAEGS
jgi:predicted ABC-type ATPase